MYNQANLQYQHRRLDSNKIKDRSIHNRSNSSSKIKKKKGKFSNVSMNKLKNSYLHK